MPPLLLKLAFIRLPRPVPSLIRPIVRAVARRAQESLIDPQLRTHIDFWEGELQKATWFAGEELTGADIQMSFPLSSGTPGPDRRHSRPAAVLKPCRARPAAFKKGSP
jgi:glutathione S-transferase